MVIINDMCRARFCIPVDDTLKSELHGGALFRVARRPLNGFGDNSFCRFCDLSPKRQGTVMSYEDAVLCGRVMCSAVERPDRLDVILQRVN